MQPASEPPEDTGSDQWRRLHPLSPLLRSGRALIAALAIVANQIRVAVDEPLLAATLVVVCVFVAGSYGYLAHRYTGYKTSANHLEARVGMVFRSTRRVPLTRLESVDIVRPVFARLFGLVEMRVELASNAGSEIVLRYLDEQDADVLRSVLLRRVRHAAFDSIQEPGSDARIDDRPAERGIVTVPFGQILLGYGAARVLVPVITCGWLALIVGAVSPTAGLTVLVAGAVSLPALLLAVGKVLDGLHGFTLLESDEGLIVRRGLLTQLTQRVPRHRVQAIRMEEPLLWRPFRRKRLIVDIAGYRGNRPDARAETAVLLPIAPPEVIDLVLVRVFDDLRFDGSTFTMAPRRARWRLPLRWQSLAVCWTQRHAIVRSGVLKRKIDIVPHVKVQSVRKTQGPWQRRLDLASLHIDTAGVTIKVSANHRTESDVDELIWASRRHDELSRSRNVL